VPYLRVANVQDGYLDLGEIKTVRIAPTLAEKLLLRRGDVLMNEGGDFDKLGRGTVWNDEISPCVHQNHVFRVRPNSGDLRSTYLALWSQSEFGKKYFVLSSKQSTNLASINSTQLKRFLVALPSPEEQRRIESRLSAANLRVEAFRRERDKMSVLKDGLVHDLLTGRIRVNVKSG
jgi:type I restriction enzyme S subunit